MNVRPDPTYRIAVVIPCFKVRCQVLDVISRIPDSVWRIYAVDDACPERSGQLLIEQCSDPRLHVLLHESNLGVGGAVMTGYRQAMEDGASIIVKLDGDGQLDPALLPLFCTPLIEGQADYAKGNRFYDPDGLHSMPPVRLLGNAALSFFSKLSTGYWDIFDPTNGYTAICADVLAKLPLDKISERYFFESDMLFRLNTLRAVVVDIPMVARYGDEVSNLRISTVIGEFLGKHLRNFAKRVVYNYFLRDMSLASLELLAGLTLLGFGTGFGLYRWHQSAEAGVETPAGTVMLAALPVMLGLQFLLAFFGYDIATVPRRPRTARLRKIPSLEPG